MSEQEVNLWLMTNKENFPQEFLPHLKKKLLEMDEEKWSNLALIQLKSPMTMLLISIFGGYFGIDRFMLDQTGAGVGKLLTGGGCGVWWIVDIFLITKLTQKYNWEKLQMWL